MEVGAEKSEIEKTVYGIIYTDLLRNRLIPLGSIRMRLFLIHLLMR